MSVRPCGACGKTIVARYRRCRACRKADPKPTTQRPGQWDGDVFMALFVAAARCPIRSMSRRLGSSPWLIRRWLDGRTIPRRATQRRIAERLGANNQEGGEA